MIYFLIGYMWLFLHRPFEVWTWLADIRIERIFMLCMLFYWVFFSKKNWISNRAHFGVVLMALAFGLTTLFGPYSSFQSEIVQNWYKFFLFYIIVVSTVHTEQDLKSIIISFVVIMGLYEFHSLYEYFCGRGVYRMGIWRMIGVGTSYNDPNTFSASVNYGIPFLLPCFYLAKKTWQRYGLYSLFFLALICIALTGSRTGIAGLVSLLGIASVLSTHRWKILCASIILFGVLWLSLPTELQFRYLTLFDPSLGPENAQVSADSRLNYFLIAVDLWKQNMLFGVGPGGFSVASGTDMQSHSLYAQLLSEVGLVGIIAFLVFILTLIRNYLVARKIYSCIKNENVKFLYLVVVAASTNVLQLFVLGFGGHNLFRFTWLLIAAFSAIPLNLLLQKRLNSEL